MTADPAQLEIAALRSRLEEAEETLRAIRGGMVDAFMVDAPAGQRVYTLQGADRPYRLLVEQMQQGAATIYSDGMIAYGNQQLADLLKLAHEKLAGVALRDFVAPDDRPAYDELLQLGRSGSAQGEICLRQADGASLPTTFAFNALPEDCGVPIGVIITDLTARRQHEQQISMLEELRESEERFRPLVEQVQDYAIFRTNTEGIPITWNEGVRRVLGFEESEFIGKDISTLIFSAADISSGIARRELQEAAASGKAADDRWMVRRDGKRFFASGTTSALRNGAGELIGFTKVLRDLSEQKRLEDELRETSAVLSEADRRKDEFLAMLAHELRNPLAPLRNALQIVRLTSDNTETTLTAIAMMDRQIRHMVRMVDDLLDASRINLGKIELRVERLMLGSIVRQAVEAARPTFEAINLRLIVKGAETAIPVLADGARLIQVIGNMLNNACKFSENNGQVILEVAREGNEAVIRVRDTGIGIAPEQLQRIFGLFVQADTSLERSITGLGIGLALVKKLIEMHGGAVSAYSEGLGRGSEFTVRLPVLLEAPVELPPSPTQQAERVVHRRILVVDDNRDSALSLAMLLQMAGHETNAAHDGLAAVEAAARFRPELILLDIGLPKLNGYEVARKIRDQPWGREMVLIALSGWGQEEDKRRSKQSGFNGHLVKPVDSDTLARLVGSVFSSSIAGSPEE